MIANLVELYISALLLSLRIGPVFAFAPPFTMMKIPVIVRVLLSIAIAGWLASALPQEFRVIEEGQLFVHMLAEVFKGLLAALGLQIAFAAILFVGRTLDFQAGFALALLADPSLQSRMPLIGSFLAYAAAMVFFAGGGANELLALWAQSVERSPIGAYPGALNLSAVFSLLSVTFVSAVGLAGLVLLSLLMIDLTVGFLSRTLPQMNVLLLGFQVKSIAILLLLPLVLSGSGLVFLNILVAALGGSADIMLGGARVGL